MPTQRLGSPWRCGSLGRCGSVLVLVRSGSQLEVANSSASSRSFATSLQAVGVARLFVRHPARTLRAHPAGESTKRNASTHPANRAPLARAQVSGSLAVAANRVWCANPCILAVAAANFRWQTGC
jgi:hypothetical protein